MTTTPSEKWTNSILIYKKKCQQISKISKSIRYVGAINEYGRTLTGAIQSGIKPFLKADQVKKEFFIISTLISLRNEESKVIGGLDYIVLKHKKVIIVVLQEKKITYYISIDVKENNVEKIISKIKKII